MEKATEMSKEQTITLPDGSVWELNPESIGGYIVQPNDRIFAFRQKPDPDPFGEVERLIEQHFDITMMGTAFKMICRAIIKLCDGRYQKL